MLISKTSEEIKIAFDLAHRTSTLCPVHNQTVQQISFRLSPLLETFSYLLPAAFTVEGQHLSSHNIIFIILLFAMMS